MKDVKMVREFIFKGFQWGFYALLIIIITTFLIYWLTYIDKTIIKGSAYGLDIGESKKQVYENLPKILDDIGGGIDSVFIEIVVSSECSRLLAVDQGYTVMTQTLLHETGYDKYRNSNQWDFYINASYFNRLSLKFCDQRLCEIYRHRKYFELP